MDELYAIVVKREKKADYYWPVSLEIIDEYFTKYKRIGVMEILRHNDSVLTETNPDMLAIKKIIGDRLVEDKNTYIIEDPFVLTFSFDKLFDRIEKRDINRIHNHLMVYKSKKGSNNFKSAIDLLKENKELFLNKFPELSYCEQRIIRSIVNSNVDIYKLLKIEDKKADEIGPFAPLKQELNYENKVEHDPVIILERTHKNDIIFESDKEEA